MYSKEQRQKCGFFTMLDLADAMHIDDESLRYAITCKKIPAPTHTWGNGVRKYYTIDEVDELCRHPLSRRAE